MLLRLLLATLTIAALAPAAAGAAVAPPAPTGADAVGFTRLTLTDHSRVEQLAVGGGSRRIPLRVWYPAARPGAVSADVLTPAE